MKNPLRYVAAAGAVLALALSVQAQTNWDAFNDFYFDPPSVTNIGGSWTGNTTPNSAWQYGGGNVNCIGAPCVIGSFFTDGSLFYNDAVGNSVAGEGAYISTGPGTYLAYYTDNQGWNEQIGIYNYGAGTNFPGFGVTNTNRLWLVAANLQGGQFSATSAEGIAAVVQWTAPFNGAFQFTSSFLPATGGYSGPNGPTVDVAIVSDQGVELPDTVLTLGSAATNIPPFTLVMSAGEQVQWSVGDNFQFGSAVGLQADVVEVATPPVLESGALSTASPYQVIVDYSVGVDPTSATDAANYTFNNGYTVTNVTMNGAASVVLTITPGLSNNSTLTVNGVKSSFGLATIATNSTTIVRAPQTSWDAFNDFYFAPTTITNTSGTTNTWTGNTTETGVWTYGALNLNIQGNEPASIGQYMNVGPTFYPLAKGQQIPSPGYYVDYGSNHFLAYYSSADGWGEEIGLYNFGGSNYSPGFGLTNTNRLWQEAGNIEGAGQFSPTAGEGIGSGLEWIAPLPGTYRFTASFLPSSGETETNANGPTVDVAICSEVKGVQYTNFPRTVLTWGSAATTVPMFELNMNAGDNVEFQVGDNFQAGSPVGTQVDVEEVPQAPVLQWALATAANGTQVTLNFNEPLDLVSAGVASNFIVNGTTVTASTLNFGNASQVILTVNPGLSPTTKSTVTVNGLLSNYGLVPVATNSTVAIVYQTSWDAYNDFYFDPQSVQDTGGSWTGNTNYNPTWQYIGDNVNGIGAPPHVGTFGNGNYFALSAGNALAGLAQYTATGPGEYLAYYTDIEGWGEEVGIYNYGFETNAPGYELTNTNRLWLEDGWLGNAATEGIAGGLLWTAPYAGKFLFTGSFLPASEGTPNSLGSVVDVAIADNVGGNQGTPYPQTQLTFGSDATVFPPFTLTMNGGDQVEWQVGGDFAAGNPVGVQADVQLQLPLTLSLTISNGNAVISWPISATGYTLQSSTSVSGPWSAVSTGVVANGSENTVTLPVSHSGSEFFRLEQ